MRSGKTNLKWLIKQEKLAGEYASPVGDLKNVYTVLSSGKTNMNTRRSECSWEAHVSELEKTQKAVRIRVFKRCYGKEYQEQA